MVGGRRLHRTKIRFEQTSCGLGAVTQSTLALCPNGWVLSQTRSAPFLPAVATPLVGRSTWPAGGTSVQRAGPTSLDCRYRGW